MNTWQVWLTVIGMGVVTLAVRMSFILLPADARVPELLKRSLVYIGAAVLPALVMPDVLFRGQVGAYGFDPLRLVAAILAGLVAWRTRSIFATLATGLGALLLMRHFLSP
jgi:branched-subunit amino acid transport protein